MNEDNKEVISNIFTKSNLQQGSMIENIIDVKIKEIRTWSLNGEMVDQRAGVK